MFGFVFVDEPVGEGILLFILEKQQIMNAHHSRCAALVNAQRQLLAKSVEEFNSVPCQILHYSSASPKPAGHAVQSLFWQMQMKR